MKRSSDNTNIQEQLKEVEAVLFGKDGNKPSSRSCDLIRFIRARLKQRNLLSHYHESDVLAETYFIAERKILGGENVERIERWLRAISNNVVRDLYKKKKRLEDKINHLIEKGICSEGQIGEDEPEEKYLDQLNRDKLYKAWESLSQKDKHVLSLRIIENMEWKSISTILNVSISTARKRGERSLNKLRSNFFSSEFIQESREVLK